MKNRIQIGVRNTLLMLVALCAANFALSSIALAQVAPNFSIKDCSDAPHDLYQDLDAGKAVIIVWVMPCTECALPLITTNGVAKELSNSYPGRVKMYVLDDFGETDCAALRGWLKTYSINATGSYVTVASTPTVPMTDYGEIGMPKIIAVHGSNREIIYRSENNVDGFALRDSIKARLATASVPDQSSAAIITPNPVRGDMLTLRLPEGVATLPGSGAGNLPGVSPSIMISTVTGDDATPHDAAEVNGTSIRVSTAHLAAGAYMLRMISGGTVYALPFTVIR
jgi:hypothetical protein